MVRFNLLSLSWREIFPVRNIIPPLSHADHKGSMGRIGVIGGSADYTGAPFYAADSALKFGADLSFVFCSKEASTPIKCYSPELMVTSFYDDSKLMSEDTNIVEQEMSKSISRVREALPRIHGLVIGPGLGRHENVLRTVEGIIEEVKSKNLHVVVDADGLFLLNRNPSLFRDYSRCIITPNKMEFDRLSEAVRNQLRNHEVASPTIETILQELSVENEAVKTRALSLALGGVTVYRKGEVDLITSGNDVYAITERGSPRRCGGQGDILAGTLVTAYYWAFKAEPQNLLNISTQLTNNTKIESFESRVDLDDIAQIFPEVQANERAILSKSLATAGGAQRLAPSTSSFPSSASRDRIGAILASLLAGNIVKQASSLAFNKFGRSMTAPNVIGDLGNAFNTFVDDKA